MTKDQLKNQKHYNLENSKDLDPLMDRIGDSRFVLLGEASHGTHEFYTWRTAITKRLIEEKGFKFLAVEGDWPDCYLINRFVKCYPGAGFQATDVLSKFRRWPTWMWANWEVAALTEWLKEHNKSLAPEHRVGFYGLDIYSLWESMEILINYLKKEDPTTAELAMEAINCFEPYEERGGLYSREVGISESCRDEAIKLLIEINKRSNQYNHDPEAGLNADINAMVVANGENYYRSMVSFNDNSWNIRDRHMAESLEKLINYHGEDTKVIVWEHNTHIGDARATSMKDEGLLNLGQLVRERYGDKEAVLVGFGSYEGSVIAGRIWGGNMQELQFPAAQKGSFEEMLHEESATNKLLIFNKENNKTEWLGHRAIGVVYRPEYDRGNYVPTLMNKRYDAFIYLDQTKALHPMHNRPDGHLTPDTYPFAF